jgi:transposase-like protein
MSVEMGIARRQFTDEFKLEAVGLLASSGQPLSQIVRRVHAALWLTPWPPCARRIAGNYDVKADEKVLS